MIYGGAMPTGQVRPGTRYFYWRYARTKFGSPPCSVLHSGYAWS